MREFHAKAKLLHDHPVLLLDNAARHSAARGLADCIIKHRYTCYACAIMPDHVHLVIRKHKHQAEEMIENLKRLSRERLLAGGHFPTGHPVWTGGGGWKVFLDHPDEIRRTIRYVESNPEKSWLPAQRWDYVAEYDGWPLHAGHSPNSPYLKTLRAAGRCSG